MPQLVYRAQGNIGDDCRDRLQPSSAFISDVYRDVRRLRRHELYAPK